ncbi:B1 protein-like [Zophobas morio]|uniref:B1 protein-like n=1 Tax=Zophobas morio TaxID=2755281 RepID=UPI003082C0FA
MKFLAVLFVSFCVYTQCTGDVAHERAVSKCEQQSGVTPEILAEMNVQKYDNPKLRAYMFCVHKKVKFQNEAGELQGDNIKAKLKEDGYDDAVIQQVAERCLHNQETPEETTVEFTKCHHKILTPKKH